MNAGNRGGRANDHRSMTCQRCRDAVSAMLDGEQLPEDEFLIRNHLPRCSECRAAARRFQEITVLARSWRTDPAADSAPDLLEVLLDASTRPSCAGRPHLRTVGNAACGCAAGCSCGCQVGGQCRCVHTAA